MNHHNLKEHDEIVLTRDVPEYSSVVHKGDIGTIVSIYSDTGGFLVEFFNLDGSHKATLALSPDLVDKP